MLCKKEPSITSKEDYFAIKFLHAKRNIYGHVFFVIYGRIDERIIKEWVEITKNIISRLSL